MAETAFGAVITFLEKLGFFDVILPFLLVFTIVFGILEKTRVFGVEKIGDKEYPRKSINSMVAFSIAFFTVAAKQVVTSLQVSLPNVALILIIVVCFLMLAGSFMGDKPFSLEGRKYWVGFLTVVMFLAVVFIFLNSFGWLDPIVDFFARNLNTALMPIIFLVVIVGAIAFVVGGGKKEKKEEK
ncbi:MAG: hypothetical protein PHO02_01415 [Candidatus Nanoarchaeia archaeon]|nr:hypothetical protein [Candidatus Nanoarchaeia archaeon]